MSTHNFILRILGGFRDGTSGPKSKTRSFPGELAEYYPMDNGQRGVCLILNYENFKMPNYDRRTGTNIDRDNLCRVFKWLGFQVITRDNLHADATLKTLKEVAKRDHSYSDCFVLCYLSHGGLGYVSAADDNIPTEKIFDLFTADNCPSLIGKPKLFFIQACQGKLLDDGVTLIHKEHFSGSYRIPVRADFLIAYSAVPGYLSWRSKSSGSWFIQELVEELEYRALTQDLLTILTFVNQRVAIDHESFTPNDPFSNNKKIVPYITYTLTRLLKFTLKNSV
ncbi:caspase invertebrate, apoptosis-related cysteine protease [Nesidiocoris tenuis]|uniref:Caspase invertebrate, apoptosis-related cysteine protease n=1 Tax=Nesidiocoris tenuis TaxID=355587 RepID=A0ABN7AQH8_9HEMI|nr:caspase invertebrate, apoptosis-related cysteine protease [Nesidiocoris tenuis]